MASRADFQLVKVQELEESFSRRLSSKDIRMLSKNTGIPKEYIAHEIVFAAPDCTMARQYIQWTGQQELGPDHVRTKFMNTTRFVQIHGEDSIHKFLRSMITYGHPYQPVRVVRDSRTPPTDSLEDTHAYVAP